MVVRRSEVEKLFMKVEDIAADLDIDTKEANRLIQELGKRITQKGGFYITGMIPVVYYQEMKSTCFLSSDGTEEKVYALTEKRLLRLKEFCVYSGLGQNMARKLAKEIGIEKRIGRKVLYDRILFDEWCNSQNTVDI